jgi:glycosyltransferase involved in cell wall biosynthesis
MSAVAAGVTACIPTFDRADHLDETIRILLSGDTVPGTVLVSDGSQSATARAAAAERLSQHGGNDKVQLRLLPPPPCGNRCGNRNWLAAHVTTPWLMFVDDDVSVPDRFLADAVAEVGPTPAVVTAASGHLDFAWLTPRGHFRAARPGEPVSVTLQLSLWPTAVFTTLWLDETIDYGYEDADLSVRLYRHVPHVSVRGSAHRFVDRGYGNSADRPAVETATLADRARIYVAIRRARTRRQAAVLLVREIVANTGRRRRPMPTAQRPGQYAAVMRWLVGGRRPEWATGDWSAVSARSSAATAPSRTYDEDLEERRRANRNLGR